MDFALFALDHAADSVIASGGPLTPFAITEVDGERVLARFVAELAEAQQHARRSVASSANALKAAVAWDGYLTVGGERTDAVFVEASAAGDLSRGRTVGRSVGSRAAGHRTTLYTCFWMPLP